MNSGWEAFCVYDVITCLSKATADVACVWHGNQTGGTFLKLFYNLKNNNQCNFKKGSNLPDYVTTTETPPTTHSTTTTSTTTTAHPVTPSPEGMNVFQLFEKIIIPSIFALFFV